MRTTISLAAWLGLAIMATPALVAADPTPPKGDTNLRRVVRDLYVLQDFIQDAENRELLAKGEAAKAAAAHMGKVQRACAAYLLENAEVIRSGVAAVEKMTQQEKDKLRERHRELHVSVLPYSPNTIPQLQYAEEIRNATAFGAIDPKFDAGDLHELDRVMEYAKYVADTSAMKLAMHPVQRHLPLEQKKYYKRQEKAEGVFVATVLLQVQGGLAEDNIRAMESVKLPPEVQGLRWSEAAEALPPGLDKNELAELYPTRTATRYLSVPSSDMVEPVLKALKDAGFQETE